MLKAISDTLRLHGRGINLSALQISDAPFATPAVLAFAYAYQQATEWRNSARARLQLLGYRNVEVRAGDGYKGWPEAAPFDRILLLSGARKRTNYATAGFMLHPFHRLPHPDNNRQRGLRNSIHRGSCYSNLSGNHHSSACSRPGSRWCRP